MHNVKHLLKNPNDLLLTYEQYEMWKRMILELLYQGFGMMEWLVSLSEKRFLWSFNLFDFLWSNQNKNTALLYPLVIEIKILFCTREKNKKSKIYKK